MALIYQLPTQLPGTVDVFPSQKFAIFGDNLSTVTTAGYLNAVNLEGFTLSSSDILLAFYSYNLNTKSGTFATFSVAMSGTGVITLTQADAGVVNSGTVNQLAYYAATGTAVSGLTGANSATVVTSSAGVPAMTASMTNGQVLIGSTGATPTPAALTAGNAIAITNGAASISVAYTPIRASGTEASNLVTASGQVGIITTSALTTAAGANYAITWTNTSIATTSVVQLSLMGGTNTVNNFKFKCVVGSGSATLTIYNTDPSNALNGTILIGYAVL